MKKKQLNRRQIWRIRKMQDAYAERAAKKDARLEESLNAAELGKEQKGIVISNFGQQLDIEALEGKDQGKVFRCFQRSNIDSLVTGDYVIWQEGDPVGVVIAALPRENFLERPSSLGELRPIAANIDQLIIVVAPAPEPFANLIDRYLVAAEHYCITPILLMNKADLIDEHNREQLEDLLSVYDDIGYSVLTVCARTGEGIPSLKVLLDDKTSVFVGQSGVGKSALVNTLLPDANTEEGALSEARDKGRHTTTSARLYHFPEGGDLIDSPGIREFHLEHLDNDTLLTGFIEFRPYLGNCRFRDCRHDREPGCALKNAVEQEDIHPRRMESYRLISQTLT